MIKLYSYFRSSTSYRVRIGLHLKNISFETIPVNLLKGEQNLQEYHEVNPMNGLPTLDHDGFRLTQSLAILNYIDNLAPEPPLASGNLQELAYVRQIALIIATDIHPLINLRVTKWLPDNPGAQGEWYRHWVTKGMAGVEALLRDRNWHGDFALGNRPSVADLCIVPQMYNLRRYKMPLHDYPICCKIEKNCLALDAFQRASPEMQPDAPADLESIHGPGFKAA
jgi:maleylacetoacetate isomerase